MMIERFSRLQGRGEKLSHTAVAGCDLQKQKRHAVRVPFCFAFRLCLKRSNELKPNFVATKAIFNGGFMLPLQDKMLML